MTTMAAFFERFDYPDVEGAEFAGDGRDARFQQEKAAAYAAGVKAGEAAAATRKSAAEQFLKNVATQFDDAIARLERQVNADLAGALIAIVEKTFPTLADNLVAEEFASRIAGHVKLKSDQTLTVTAAPRRVKSLKAAFSTMARENAVKIEADESVADFAISAQWGSAGLDYDVEKAAEHILGSLQKALCQDRKDD